MKKLLTSVFCIFACLVCANAQLIFSDAPSSGEFGEAPSAWNILQGGSCITILNGAKVISLPPYSTQFEANTSVITPKMDEALPQSYSIEFDFYMYAKNFDANNEFWVELFEGDECVLDFEHAIGAINGKCSFSCTCIRENGEADEFSGFYLVNKDDWNHFKLSVKGNSALVLINGKKAATVASLKKASAFALKSEQRYMGEERSNMRGTQFRNFEISRD